MMGHDHLEGILSSHNLCLCHNQEQRQQQQQQQEQCGWDTDRAAVMVQEEVVGALVGQVQGVRTALWWCSTAP